MMFIKPLLGTETLALIVIVLITLALACLNVRSLYAKYGEENEKLLSIYVCAKFTLLILCILCRADAISFVISLVGIVAAIVFIVVGFYKAVGCTVLSCVLSALPSSFSLTLSMIHPLCVLSAILPPACCAISSVGYTQSWRTG